MATKRRRGNSWEFVVRRKHLLPRPLYLTFDTAEDGDKYCKRLEGLLDRGIVPDDVLERASRGSERGWTLDDAITLYLSEHRAGESDVPLLELAAKRVGQEPLRDIDHRWAMKWVESLKRTHELTPGTIRHYAGALARCLDWIAQNRAHLMPTNPMGRCRAGTRRTLRRT